MAWNWQLEKSGGNRIGAEETFSTQAAAETWLGEHWRDLRTEGVEKVVLLDGEDTIYTMSLEDPT
ncbi:hypothetical protein [Actinomadura oligospora]|uniref:hypothetical protein n=1 Tax=Actinomadura oligospora TaxID=111804 RepID=UPI0004794D29|nr:hypothetical protein [Actinomadura oligospora]